MPFRMEMVKHVILTETGSMGVNVEVTYISRRDGCDKTWFWHEGPSLCVTQRRLLAKMIIFYSESF